MMVQLQLYWIRRSYFNGNYIWKKIDDIRAEGARLPLLSVVLVGNNPASMSYVRGKEKACSSIGMLQKTIRLDENVSQEELSNVIMELNLDPKVDGILVQMPLPEHLDETSALELIDPQKDVDGLHPMNAGCLLTNRPGFIPCTPQGVMAMLDSIGYKDLSGKRAVVCGRSNLVGKPVALMRQLQLYIRKHQILNRLLHKRMF